jgi:hypothetical protein
MRKLLIYATTAAIAAFSVLTLSAQPGNRCAGAFLPGEDCVVSGQWTFTNANPLVLYNLTGFLKSNGSSAATAVASTGTGSVVLGTAPTISPIYAVTTIAGDGAVTIATGITAFTKGSAAAITLAAPSAGQAGTELILTAGSAFAHVVTATGLIEDGITGGSKSTLTFGAFNGATITLRAYNLKWTVVSKNVVTVT